MRVAILLGALATSVHADTNYRLCTCTENKKIAESRSLDITDSSGGKYVISTKVWTGKERAPLEGISTILENTKRPFTPGCFSNYRRTDQDGNPISR
ncbi:hypothetical protein IAQ61_005129 [Plenodomus lingam]|uniref:uncharacterized protein n=1 Tax=Leptosphaeria maculans TaxID=5022 RepID=UPI0033239C45|nr:hypothetical protein IAQ61_005129 [Plenodomus lingam]